MRESLLWQQLTVKDFFESYQWTGKKQSLLVKEQDFIDSWQTASVQNFFNANNWKGESIVNSNYFDNITFSLALSVPDFFRCFNWATQDTISYEDTTEFNPIENVSDDKEDVVRTNKKAISLNDFSQLF